MRSFGAGPDAEEGEEHVCEDGDAEVGGGDEGSVQLAGAEGDAGEDDDEDFGQNGDEGGVGDEEVAAKEGGGEGGEGGEGAGDEYGGVGW